MSMGYVEQCLYDYKANVAELKILREEYSNLMSLHGQTYEINERYGLSDPVAGVAHHAIKLEREIARMEKKIKPVQKLIRDLRGSSLRVQQMNGILRLRYIEHEDKEVIKRKIAISERTLWRRSGELITLAKRYFR